MYPAYEILEHPADVGFLAYGATLEILFANAALAMLSLACDPALIAEREQREIRATGAYTELLLYAWLAEILGIADAEGLFFRRVEVRELSGTHARGVAYGEPFDRSRHRPGTYIKAVTLHQFRVEETDDGWRARVYLDV